MTDRCNTLDAKCNAVCPPPASGRRWAARVVFALVVALAVAVIEAKLIEQVAATGADCGAGAACRVIRIVDNSLASGFAPIANLR
ncbi:MAG: hypothetical protein ABI900_04280 [Betaproteobacteria bacterium]